MALNIARVEYNTIVRWGVLLDQQVLLLPGQYKSTGEFLMAHDIESLKRALREDNNLDEVELKDVRLLSPITRNQQFICLGANYKQHMIESGMRPDDKHFNMFFTKAPSCIVPHDSVIEKPSFVKFLDYEVELGLVFRQPIRGPVRVTRENLYQYVAGLVIVNDLSARDIQIPQMQFYKGKSYRTFGPVGPYLCLLEPEDMPLLDKLSLELRVNGQLRQSDHTGNLVHGPCESISELSGMHDVDPGDLLATGTPSGCALSVPSPARQKIGALMPEKLKWKMFNKIQSKRSQYLQDGDIVKASIRSACGTIDLGEQRNLVQTSKVL